MHGCVLNYGRMEGIKRFRVGSRARSPQRDRRRASMNRMTVASLVVLAALTAGAGSVSAAIYAQETLDRYFRIEYNVSPAATQTIVSGYVYLERAGYGADRVQLLIERLNAAGTVIGTSTTWVLGGVPPGSRAFFSAKVEPAASYRVQVLSFDWTGKSPSSN